MSVVNRLGNIFKAKCCQRNTLLKSSLVSSTIQQKLIRNTQNNSKNQRPESSRPELWYTSYPISLIGKRQSPINIATDECLRNNRDLQLKPLIIDYPKQMKGLVLKNPRDDKFYGWRVDVLSKKKAKISGGPLDHCYRLAQFHCHWGKACSCGSEHTIDGKHYSAELHLVHWNSDLYSSPHEALYSEKGLTVLGVFLEACDQRNEELSKLTDLMPRVKYKGDKINIDEKNIDIYSLLPKDKSYWSYSGSLTTPPLWESVTWIVFKEPIHCTEEQIQTFRQLSYRQRSELQTNGGNGFEVNISENFRSQQPLNERPIIYVNERHGIQIKSKVN